MKHHHFSSRIAGCIMALALVTASVSGCSGPTDPIGTPEATLNPDDQELLDAVSGRDENLPLTPDERNDSSASWRTCVLPGQGYYLRAATVLGLEGTDGFFGLVDTTDFSRRNMAYERGTRSAISSSGLYQATGWHHHHRQRLQGNFPSVCGRVPLRELTSIRDRAAGQKVYVDAGPQPRSVVLNSAPKPGEDGQIKVSI